ncbi:hypothetical protein ABZ916_39150 [Streptomyces sp. NPDC046853]|uniref:hypothetical protein n=1 Tax=Streptomyces sp. NPDC046853 TaxID=3154920 RepID=UPI0033F7F361
MAYLNPGAGAAREGKQADPVANIPTPASATATDCANKINALLAALRAAGLLKT